MQFVRTLEKAKVYNNQANSKLRKRQLKIGGKLCGLFCLPVSHSLPGTARVLEIAIGVPNVGFLCLVLEGAEQTVSINICIFSILTCSEYCLRIDTEDCFCFAYLGIHSGRKSSGHC